MYLLTTSYVLKSVFVDHEISKFIPFIYLTWTLASDYLKLLVFWEVRRQQNSKKSWRCLLKVKIFREGHKIWKKSSTKNCDLLRISELYLQLSFVAFSENLNFEYVPVLTRQFFTDINLDRLYIGQVNVIGIDLWQFGLWGLQIWECRLGIVSIKEGLNTVIGGTSKLTTELYTSNYYHLLIFVSGQNVHWAILVA